MRESRGFTLVELIAGVGVICVFAVILATGAVQFLENGRASDCVANLRQWSIALGGFAQDHDGRIPRRGQGVRPVEQIDRPDDWFNALPPYLGLPAYSELVHRGRKPKPHEKSLFVCPSARDQKKPHFLAYGMNMYLSPWNRPDMHRLQEIPRPSQLAFLADGPGGWSSTVPSSQDYSVVARHRDHAHILFLDGHIQAFDRRYLGCGEGNSSKPDIRWETQTGGVNQIAIP